MKNKIHADVKNQFKFVKKKKGERIAEVLSRADFFLLRWYFLIWLRPVLVASYGIFEAHGLSSCSTWAQVPCSTWNLSSPPGIEPEFPELEA